LRRRGERRMTLALMHPANWRIVDRASKRPAYGGSPGARVYRCGNPSSPIVFTNSNPPSSTANMQPTYPLANPPNVAGAIDGAAIINRFFPKAHFVSALLNDPSENGPTIFVLPSLVPRWAVHCLTNSGGMDRFGGLALVCGPGFFCELEGFTGDDVWENAGVIELPTTAADRATAKSFLRTQCPVETEDRCESNHRSIGRADVKAPADRRRAHLGSAGGRVRCLNYGDRGAVQHCHVITVVILPCSIWMLVEIGFLRGTKGTNSYEPYPLSAA
jgi:hypothetical protein